MSVDARFYIHGIKVNSMSSGAIFTVGTNWLIGVTANSKTMNGTGTVVGDGASLSTLVSAIDDRDQWDTPFWNFRGRDSSPSAFGPSPAGRA